ncbi:MAG TPA: tetratricopeptide repeat protein, partial [Burkholderiales bacterium]|nr:tetratricopeptide repeat protein [Burkholderiales bacterium]
MQDAVGYTLSGATPRSLEALEQASHELRCYIADPVSTVQRALDASPTLVMGHVLKAYLHLLGTEPGAVPVAAAALAEARTLPANERERGHTQAIGALVQGRWREAGAVLEDLTIEYPRDALALQAGHQIDFFTGDSRMLRDRIARALPAWSRSLPGYHAVLGMHAFGLEETGEYALAEARGRASVELEPRDGWGQHAVAHVMEMQGRRREGIAWMRAEPEAWSSESFLAVHNWWHLALLHLGLDEVDEVLSLFDGPIYGKSSTVVLEMIDASAMLWRLHLRGIDLGARWEAVADGWAPVASAGNYAFNDMHAMMAFVGAGRTRDAEAVLETQRAAMEQPGDNAMFTREVGHPATLAIKAFGDGDYAQTVRLLRPIRSYAHRFGGSHAQRDVLELTLIEAA